MMLAHSDWGFKSTNKGSCVKDVGLAQLRTSAARNLNCISWADGRRNLECPMCASVPPPRQCSDFRRSFVQREQPLMPLSRRNV
jgi:hypothetical protein